MTERERRLFVRQKGQAKRMIKAIVAIVVALAAIPLSGAVEKSAGWGVAIASMAGEIVSESLSTTGGADVSDGEIDVDEREINVDAYAGLSEALVGKAALPAVFEEECLDLSDAREVMTSQDGMLLGFQGDGDAEQEFCRIGEELLSHGWVKSGSGSSTCATFTKEQGRYRWLFVTCVEVSGQTSTVIQCFEGGE